MIKPNQQTLLRSLKHLGSLGYERQVKQHHLKSV
ncbi:Uncharacterised protein [Vibrio cholerae]|nr:Uncharacterised protein [Vibrio cholerae]